MRVRSFICLTAMSLSVNSSGEKVEKEPGIQQEMEKLPATEELLAKKREFLNKKIDQLELFAKKYSTKNRRVALQALRRKKRCEQHVKYIDCFAKAMRSIHKHMDIMNKVIDLMKDITEEQEATGDMLESFCTAVNFEVEFNEDELLAELEKLEGNPDENLFEADGAGDGVLGPEVLTTASPSHPANTADEDNIEDDLEYLRRWANAP